MVSWLKEMDKYFLKCSWFQNAYLKVNMKFYTILKEILLSLGLLFSNLKYVIGAFKCTCILLGQKIERWLRDNFLIRVLVEYKRILLLIIAINRQGFAVCTSSNMNSLMAKVWSTIKASTFASEKKPYKCVKMCTSHLLCKFLCFSSPYMRCLLDI